MMFQKSVQIENPENLSFKVTSVCLRFRFILCFLLFWLTGFEQTPLPELDALFKQNQKAMGNNLVALAWKDGKLVYKDQLEKEIGDFNAKVQVPAGTLSQWLTAALVMSLVDEGKVTLDDKVSKYIPIFATYMKTYITLRHCLTFTTGIQADPVGPLKLLQKSKFQSLEDEVNVFASKREIVANPGTEIFFSQIGPDIAGRVLEIATKKTFDRLMQDRILRPLHMRSTSFSDENGLASNPSGGAVTTANDYLNFLVMILNKGMFEGKRVLSEAAVAEMEKVQFAGLPVKYMPKAAEGWKSGLGNWIAADGQTLCSVNLNGMWPFIDINRKYAAILIIKNPTGEPKYEVYTKFKEGLDKGL